MVNSLSIRFSYSHPRLIRIRHMSTFAVFIKTINIVVATLMGYSGVVVGKLISLFSKDFGRRFRNLSFRRWAKRLCRYFGMTVRVEGTPPTGRFFLVVNHVGYVDIPLIATAVDAAFIAKADLAGWPMLGRIFGAADTIFIDRGRKKDILRVIDEVESAMDRGLGVVLFPEGTSGKGDQVLPFKPSLLQFAVQGGHEVHYTTLCYRTRDGELPPSQGVCWHGDEGLLPHYKRISRLTGIEAVLKFGDEPVQGEDRKQLAADLREAMMAGFEPMP